MDDKTDGVLAWFDERITEFVGAREGSIFWYRRRNALNARDKVAELLAASERMRDNLRCVLSVNCKCDEEFIDKQTAEIDAAIRAMRGEA